LGEKDEEKVVHHPSIAFLLWVLRGGGGRWSGRVPFECHDGAGINHPALHSLCLLSREINCACEPDSHEIYINIVNITNYKVTN